ncbi:MAG TPA: phosphotransferase [Acidimicrobiales bacterium]|nr:phosphotransferase [Acidimicrobiales bacterium]
MAPEARALTALATAYLEGQAWYRTATANLAAAPVRLVAADVLAEGQPGLARLVLERGERRFQLLVGWRRAQDSAQVLHGRESAILGSVEDAGEHLLAYDALADDELTFQVLTIATGGTEHAERVRRVSTLVSHAALVFDERLFMKCYRVLEPGERPEIEVLFRLDEIGFNALLAPVGRWRGHGHDLALVREFLPSALEGRLLALTSLRDLLARASSEDSPGRGPAFVPGAPAGAELAADVDAATAQAGGDLASEMHRLGATTARLHLALAEGFGDRPAQPDLMAAVVGGSRARANAPAAAATRQLAARIAALAPGQAGRSIRVHGDFHLRRVMRAETGWLIAGFSDDPLYATDLPHSSLPARTGSPVEDLADMCFSLGVVSREALAQRPPSESELAADLAAAWCRRNRLAFLDGYATVPEVQRLLPGEPATTELLLEGFERVRERRYEATFAGA